MSAIAAAIHVVVDKGPPGNPFLIWLPLVTACIALAATVASWRAVLQAGKIWKASLLPELAPTIEHGRDKLSLRVLNVSDTVAADAGWAVLWNNRRNEGRLPERSLRGGGDTKAFPALHVRGPDADEADAAPVAIVWCRDRRGNVHVWSTDGTKETYDREEASGWMPVDLLEKLHKKRDPRAAQFSGTADEPMDPL